MSFNTFVLTDGKQNFFNQIKSQMEDTITNMYHNLDPSIKKMKHKDIAKHLRDKFLETEPAFFSTEPRKKWMMEQGIVVSNAMLFAIILFILRLLTVPAEAASRSGATAAQLLLTNGDNVGGDKVGDVGTTDTFDDFQRDLQNELRKEYFDVTIPETLKSFQWGVGTLLKTFRIPKILTNLGMDLEQVTETYMTEIVIPRIQQSWLKSADSIVFADDYNKVKGSEQKLANDVMLMGYLVQKAMLFDNDFHEMIFNGNFKSAVERAKEFTHKNTKRYRIKTKDTDRNDENETVCRSIVNRLKNADERLRWQEGFKLSSSGIPINKVLESATWGNIIDLQNKYDKLGTTPKDRNAILEEAEIGVWSAVTRQIAYTMESDKTFLSGEQRNELLNKMSSSAQGITLTETIIQKAAISYLNTQTGENGSVKQIAINAVMRYISGGKMAPLLDTLNLQVEGFKQVLLDDQKKDKQDRVQNTVDNLVPTSSFSFLLGIINSMSATTVAAILVGTAGTAVLSYVAYLIRGVLWKILKFPFKVAGMLKDKIGGTPTDYSKYTVAQLKDELQTKGLGRTGNKATLIQRLTNS